MRGSDPRRVVFLAFVLKDGFLMSGGDGRFYAHFLSRPFLVKGRFSLACMNSVRNIYCVYSSSICQLVISVWVAGLGAQPGKG